MNATICSSTDQHLKILPEFPGFTKIFSLTVKASPGEGALVPEASTSTASAVTTHAAAGAQPVVPGSFYI